jgi:hypothetical protein
MKRRRRLIDLAAVLWAALWIMLAVQVAIEVRGLRDLSSTVNKSGVAIREAGEALERLEQLPVVGAELDETSARVQAAGRSAVRSAESSRKSINDLSLMLAIAIAVIPSVGMLGFYLHVRDARRPMHYPRGTRRRPGQTVH